MKQDRLRPDLRITKLGGDLVTMDFDCGSGGVSFLKKSHWKGGRELMIIKWRVLVVKQA